MNHFKIDEKHIDINEERNRLGGGHEIHEGDHRPFNYDVRKQKHTMGNQGVENVQQASDVHLDAEEKDSVPIDKTALMTSEGKHHHHHPKPKLEIKLQKA